MGCNFKISPQQEALKNLAPQVQNSNFKNAFLAKMGRLLQRKMCTSEENNSYSKQ